MKSCRWATVAVACWVGVGACERREPAEDAVRAEANNPPAPRTQQTTAVSPSPGRLKKRVERETVEWNFPQTQLGPVRAWVTIPEHVGGERLPVLVALHGRGEALKGVEKGARGWIDDYGLLTALDRLKSPPLSPQDFQGFITSERLTQINSRLKKRAYERMLIITPYTPTALGGERGFANAEVFGEFIVERLLKRAHELPMVDQSPRATGIDGVSLGGRAALLAGLSRPQAFGAISSLQAAFDISELDEVAARARSALRNNPELKLRLLTSDEDHYLRENRVLSEKLQQLAVDHELLIVRGPHDYEFNRGPGVFEMLLYHTRALRGQVPM